MRKQLTTIIVMLAAFASTGAWAQSAAGFRGVEWGASAADIIESEGAEPEQRSSDAVREILMYKDTLAGLDCIVVYILAEDQLARARYSVIEPHTNKTDYVYDRKKLLEGLKSKYGEPAEDQTYWADDLYKDDPSEWGMALAVGHLKMFTTWETPETNIILMLAGDNYDVTLVVEYTSVEFGGIEDAAAEKAEAEKF